MEADVLDSGNQIEISDSVLSSVKKLIGIPEEDETFDIDVILNINAALTNLFQLGAIPEPYTVTSKDDSYEDLAPGASAEIINQIKMYLVYKVRLGFDSSTLSSSVIQVLKDLIAEAEWRMMDTFK